MFLQRQKQEENKNGKEILRAQMEPDLYVFAGAPAGVSGAHAGDHIVGPSQGEGGGERIPGRGKRPEPRPSGTLTHSISANPLEWGHALNKAPDHNKVLVVQPSSNMDMELFIYCVKLL